MTFDTVSLERLADMISSRMSTEVRALSDRLDTFQDEMRVRLTILEQRGPQLDAPIDISDLAREIA